MEFTGLHTDEEIAEWNNKAQMELDIPQGNAPADNAQHSDLNSDSSRSE
jgi:hypothetical protein